MSFPPESLHLSLNRHEEIGSSSPDQTIESLGVISGDLVFYTANPLAFSATEGVSSERASPGGVVVRLSESVVTLDRGKEAVLGGAESERNEKVTILEPEVPELNVGVKHGMDVDQELETKEERCSFSNPGFLKRVMEEEKGIAAGDLGILVIGVHAVFLESGFVVCGGNGSRLPQGWASPTSHVIMVSYTIPGLESIRGGASVAAINLKFSHVGKFVNVYGSSSSGSSGVYRVCFNVSRFASSLASSIGGMKESDEDCVFELWKMVKDGLSLPLLIDVCEKYDLPPPPCFMRLPIDLKIRILELLPGVDLARIGCVNMEMKYLSSNDELWVKKFIEEFGISDGKGLFGRRWKEKFVICWEKKKKNGARRLDGGPMYGGLPYWRRPVPFAPPSFNIVGGDYDRLPAIGGGIGGSSGSGRAIPRLFSRQNFSPRCNFDRFGV